MTFFTKASRSSLFLGLGERRHQVRIPLSVHDQSHTQILGPTRFGKGLLLQTMLLQLLMLLRTVFVIDPRRDVWLPNVLGRYCEDRGLPYFYLDANAGHAQWSPLLGKNRNQALALLTTGFDIEPRGDAADFHRLKDRELANLIASNENLRNLDWGTLYHTLLRDYPDEAEGAQGFMYSLREYANEPFVQTCGGIDISGNIDQPGVVYVTGDLTSNVQMRILKMFTLSVLQATIARGQGCGGRVELVLDEFRKLMSEAALNCLSMASASNTHAYVVHQSLGDISQPVGSLSAEAVRNIVTSNCRARVSFQALDPDTADYVSRISGTRPNNRGSTSLSRNRVLGETKSSSSTLVEDEAPIVHSNVMLSLPERCALLSLRGAPEFFYVCPVPTIQNDRFTTPTVFDLPDAGGYAPESPTAAKDLIDVD